MATYIQEGNAIDYTPSSDVAAGDVIVQGDLVGVAKRDIASGSLGSLATSGVFSFAKAAEDIAAGVKVYWDESESNVTATSTDNTYVGKAVAGALTAAATINVKLDQ